MIRVKRGQKENLPTGYPGEPLMCLDTGEFYVGGNHGNVLINGPWVTPEAYGARGDGVHDDTAAVQAAVNYCLTPVTRPRTLVASGRYRLTSSVIIDRLVDTALTLGEFRIVASGPSAGFYVDTAIDMFDSSLAFTTSPVSEGICFEGIQFEASSSALAAYVLNGKKFLRVQFLNCHFSSIKCLTSTIYVQSIYITKCRIRSWAGTFFYSTGDSLDVSFEGNLIEFGGAFWASGAYVLGCRFINNLSENCSGRPLAFVSSAGIFVAGNYFEQNLCESPYVDFGLASVGVSLSGNFFWFTTAQNEDVAFFAVHWGETHGVSSTGNYCTGLLHDPVGMDCTYKSFASIGDSDGHYSGVPSANLSDLSFDKITVGELLISEPGNIKDILGLDTADSPLFASVGLSALADGTIPRSVGFGTELVLNGEFDSDTTGWDKTACTIDSVAGGESGNCLELTRVSGNIQYFDQIISGLTIGAPYEASIYRKSGTSGDGLYYFGIYLGEGTWGEASGTSSDTWIEQSLSFIAMDTVCLIRIHKYSDTPGTMLFDTVSVHSTPRLFNSPLSTDGTAVECSGGFSIGGDANYSSFAADGILTMAGTARTLNEIWIDAGGIKAPGIKPAAQIDHGMGIAWEFSDATDDTIVFNMRIPLMMDRTVAPAITIGWSSAATEKVGLWQLEYLYTAAGEDTTAAAQGTLPETGTTPAQAQGLVATIFDGIDAPGATDLCFHGRLKRLGADASDTLEDTALLLGLCMSFTTDKLGTAL